MDEDNSVEEKAQNNKTINIALIVAIVVIVGLVGYICYDKFMLDGGRIDKSDKLDSTTKKQTSKDGSNDEVDDDNDKSSEEQSTANNQPSTSIPNTRMCSGAYYGEASGTQGNGLSYDYKYTYTLNDNNTFSLEISNASRTEGIYMITGNTISLISQKHTSGPKDLDPQYSTEDYVMADDCSYILVDDRNGVSFKATKR